MTITEAVDIIESDEGAREAEHEMLADLGSSAFFGGAREPGDAMAIARMQLDAMRDHEADSAYDATVAEAYATADYFESIAPTR